MSKTMAEVLGEHQFMYHSFNGVTQKRYLACSCGELPLAGDHPTHLAAALSAAGFGLVADAKAEALEEAAANITTNDPLDYWNGHLPEGLGFQEAMSRWLKAHAKAKRATS